MKLTEVIAELWLARRLGLPLSWAGGVTTREMRRDRIRAEILERGLADAIAGNAKGRPETWAEVFQRIYRQPLQQQEI